MIKKRKLILLALSILFVPIAQAQGFSNYTSSVKSCGNGMITDIPSALPKIIKIVYLSLQIAVPVLLVIFGMIDLIKAVIAGKEDEIKKSQGVFIRRLITGVLVFFILSIVKFLIYFAADDDKSANIIDCTNCFLNNNCEEKEKNEKTTTTKKTTNKKSKTAKKTA